MKLSLLWSPMKSLLLFFPPGWETDSSGHPTSHSCQEGGGQLSKQAVCFRGRAADYLRKEPNTFLVDMIHMDSKSEWIRSGGESIFQRDAKDELEGEMRWQNLCLAILLFFSYYFFPFLWLSFIFWGYFFFEGLGHTLASVLGNSPCMAVKFFT